MSQGVPRDTRAKIQMLLWLTPPAEMFRPLACKKHFQAGGHQGLCFSRWPARKMFQDGGLHESLLGQRPTQEMPVA